MNKNLPDRRSTRPDGISRQLRQEAHFGCCKCGIPIIQYHHIVPWAEDNHYRAEDMMVLCPLHHDEATKGAMSEEEQRALKIRPFNKERGYANGFLSVRQNYCAADLGSITVVGEGTFLSVGSAPILGFQLRDNRLEISATLFDPNGNLLAQIDRNEWISGDPVPWDIEADWQKLLIRRKARDISLLLDAKKIPMSVSGRFFCHGHAVAIGEQGIFFETRRSGFHELALVGSKVTIDPEDGNVRFEPQQAFGEAVIVSWPDRRERLWKAKVAWEQLRTTQAKKG